MWTCPGCGEPNEDQFDSCWRCAAEEREISNAELLSQTPAGVWRLALMACKFYILAVPAAVLLSVVLAPSPAQWSEWIQRSLEHQRASLVLGLQGGYVLCLALLLVSAVFHDRKAARQALIFIVLALLSLLVFCPFAHVLPTRV